MSCEIGDCGGMTGLLEACELVVWPNLRKSDDGGSCMEGFCSNRLDDGDVVSCGRNILGETRVDEELWVELAPPLPGAAPPFK